MSKTIFTFGGIAGAVIIVSVMLSVSFGAGSTHIAALEWLGYAVMILAFGVIFVAIKGYRDNELGGVITFATGVKVGIGVSLVASVIYIIAWEAYLLLTDYAFIEDYTASLLETKAAEGATEAELAAARSEMEAFNDQYSNPLFRLAISFTEIFPVGLLITLISAAVLRNSRVLPAEVSEA